MTRTVKFALVTIITMAAIVALYVIGSIPATAANAAVTPPSWSEQACHALAAYTAGEHRAVSLERLTIAAAHLGNGYLKADMLELAADASSPSKNAAKYLAVAVQYAGEDCSGGA